MASPHLWELPSHGLLGRRIYNWDNAAFTAFNYTWLLPKPPAGSSYLVEKGLDLGWEQCGRPSLAGPCVQTLSGPCHPAEFLSLAVEGFGERNPRLSVGRWALRVECSEQLRRATLVSCVLFVCLFWPWHIACGILVPWPGIEPVPPAVEARSPNHWTTREFPPMSFEVDARIGFGVWCYALRFSSTLVALHTQRAGVTLHGSLSEVRLGSVEVRKTWGFFWVSISAVTAPWTWPGPVAVSGSCAKVELTQGLGCTGVFSLLGVLLLSPLGPSVVLSHSPLFLSLARLLPTGESIHSPNCSWHPLESDCWIPNLKAYLYLSFWTHVFKFLARRLKPSCWTSEFGRVSSSQPCGHFGLDNSLWRGTALCTVTCLAAFLTSPH